MDAELRSQLARKGGAKSTFSWDKTLVSSENENKDARSSDRRESLKETRRRIDAVFEGLRQEDPFIEFLNRRNAVAQDDPVSHGADTGAEVSESTVLADTSISSDRGTDEPDRGETRTDTGNRGEPNDMSTQSLARSRSKSTASGAPGSDDEEDINDPPSQSVRSVGLKRDLREEPVSVSDKSASSTLRETFKSQQGVGKNDSPGTADVAPTSSEERVQILGARGSTVVRGLSLQGTRGASPDPDWSSQRSRLEDKPVAVGKPETPSKPGAGTDFLNSREDGSITEPALGGGTYSARESSSAPGSLKAGPSETPQLKTDDHPRRPSLSRVGEDRVVDGRDVRTGRVPFPKADRPAVRGGNGLFTALLVAVVTIVFGGGYFLYQYFRGFENPDDSPILVASGSLQEFTQNLSGTESDAVLPSALFASENSVDAENVEVLDRSEIPLNLGEGGFPSEGSVSGRGEEIGRENPSGQGASDKSAESVFARVPAEPGPVSEIPGARTGDTAGSRAGGIERGTDASGGGDTFQAGGSLSGGQPVEALPVEALIVQKADEDPALSVARYYEKSVDGGGENPSADRQASVGDDAKNLPGGLSGGGPGFDRTGKKNNLRLASVPAKNIILPAARPSVLLSIAGNAAATSKPRAVTDRPTTDAGTLAPRRIFVDPRNLRASDKQQAIQPTRSRGAGSSGPVTSPYLARVAANGRYLVQLTSRRRLENARRSFELARIRSGRFLAGFPPLISAVNLPGRGRFFRASVGPFSSIVSARELCKDLKRTGQECLVVRSK